MMEWPKFFMALVTGAAEQQAAAREASSAARSRAIVVALCVNCSWLFPHAPLPRLAPPGAVAAPSCANKSTLQSFVLSSRLPCRVSMCVTSFSLLAA